MIGRRVRRSGCLTAVVLAAALALPALAAAEATTSAEGAVLESIPTSPSEARAFWTRARREAAEPLPPVTVPGSAPEAAAAPEGTREAVPAAEGAVAPDDMTAARTAAAKGAEVSAAESAVFPDSANGRVFGVFSRLPLEEFQCSGSVVAGNVVLTAGHCVIDPTTGNRALFVVFESGYRDGDSAAHSVAVATGYSFTRSWEQTAKPAESRSEVSHPNEGSDVAFLQVIPNVEKAAGGSLGIAFDQPCNQTYTQYGYPAEEPYGGKVLYSNTAAYAGPDTNPYFSPTPMKIASDFTKGASGGPWTVGPATSPTVLSVTAYGYENQPGYLFGPYFGEAARKAYELALGKEVPIGIEEVCKPLEVPSRPSEPTPTPSPTPTPPSAAPATSVRLKVMRVRHRANGSAVLIAKVSEAGRLKLTGAAVRAETVNTQNAGKYRLIVATKGRTGMKLRRQGSAKVGVKVAFSASGKTRRVARSIRLTRRQVARSSARHSRPAGGASAVGR